MNILGAIIRTDEIVGISALTQSIDGRNFHYCFSVITRSSSVEFCSEYIEDVNIATKFEQQRLAEFKGHYEYIRNKIALQIGDAQSILMENERQSRIEDNYKLFNEASDRLNKSIKVLKIKSRDQLLDQLGRVWTLAKDIKELAI